MTSEGSVELTFEAIILKVVFAPTLDFSKHVITQFADEEVSALYKHHIHSLDARRAGKRRRRREREMNWISRKVFLYKVTFGLYVLEWWEQCLFSILFHHLLRF